MLQVSAQQAQQAQQAELDSLAGAESGSLMAAQQALAPVESDSPAGVESGSLMAAQQALAGSGSPLVAQQALEAAAESDSLPARGGATPPGEDRRGHSTMRNQILSFGQQPPATPLDSQYENS